MLKYKSKFSFEIKNIMLKITIYADAEENSYYLYKTQVHVIRARLPVHTYFFIYYICILLVLNIAGLVHIL